jgi:hypothetical protein
MQITEDWIRHIVTEYFGEWLPESAWNKMIDFRMDETTFHRMTLLTRGKLENFDGFKSYSLYYRGMNAQSPDSVLVGEFFDTAKDKITFPIEAIDEQLKSVLVEFYPMDEVIKYSPIYDAKVANQTLDIDKVFDTADNYFTSNGIDRRILGNLVMRLTADGPQIHFKSTEKRKVGVDSISNYALHFSSTDTALVWHITKTNGSSQTQLFSSKKENYYSIISVLERLYSKTLITAYIEAHKQLSPEQKREMLANLKLNFQSQCGSHFGKTHNCYSYSLKTYDSVTTPTKPFILTGRDAFIARSLRLPSNME